MPIAKQCHGSVQHRRLGMFLSAAEEVALIENLGVRCFQHVRGREMRPSLGLNAC